MYFDICPKPENLNPNPWRNMYFDLCYVLCYLMCGMRDAYVYLDVCAMYVRMYIYVLERDAYFDICYVHTE